MKPGGSIKLSRGGGIAILLAAWLALAALIVYQEVLPGRVRARLKVVALYVTGRTGQCSIQQALRSYDDLARQYQVGEEIKNKMKLVRSEDGLQLFDTPQGSFWVPPPHPLDHLLAEQERKIYGAGKFGVQPGDIVLDCGAHVGVFTRQALGAGARLVVAIEPVPLNVESLRRNFASEIAAGRVRVYPKGLWHKDDEMTMWVYDHSVLDSFVMKERWEEKKQPRELKLPVTTIDKLVAELELPRVDFVKMDIEGAERHAVQGGLGTIAKYRPRMALATENLPDDQDVVPRLVRKAWPGYRQACGPCRPFGAYEIRPDVLYFY